MYIKFDHTKKTRRKYTNIFFINYHNYHLQSSCKQTKIAIGEIIIILIIHSTHSTESWAEPKDSTTTTTTQAPTPFDQSYMNNLYMNQQQLSTKSTEDPYKFYYSSTTTTTTSAPPYSYNYNSYNANNNNNNNNNANNNINQYNYNQYTSTTPPPSPPSTTTSIQSAPNRPTISPFYYGLDFYKKQKSTTLAPLFNSFATSSTKNPYDFNNFENSYFNQLQKTSTIEPPPYYAYTSTAAPPPPPPPPIESTTAPPAAAIAAYYSQQTSTRHSIFDVYLKRVASTTKSPYNFENFGFFKSSTTNPKFSYNLFGANSNSAPNNVTSTG